MMRIQVKAKVMTKNQQYCTGAQGQEAGERTGQVRGG
jgi:hypothetical protein